MRLWVYLLSCILTLCIAKGDVQRLDLESFSERVTPEKTWVIMFYAPWCGRCSTILPIWDSLANQFGDSENIMFGKVDCTAHHSLCGRQLIGKYPVFVLYKENYKIRFENRERTLENFAQWINSDPQPIPLKQENEEVEPQESRVVSLNKESIHETDSGVWLVAFCAPWGIHCPDVSKIWHELSIIAYDYKVGMLDITEEVELAAKYHVASAPTIKIIFDGEIQNYSGGRSVLTFDSYIRNIIEERKPKEDIPDEEGFCRIFSDVQVLTVTNFDRKTKGKNYFVEFYAPYCNFCAELEPVIAELADNSKYNVAKVNAIEEKELRFKFHVAGYPTLILIKADGSHIRFRGERTVENFAAFIDEQLSPVDKLELQTEII